MYYRYWLKGSIVSIVSIAVLLVFFALAVTCTFACAATDEQIEGAIVNGTAWLAGQQNDDGSIYLFNSWYSVATTAFAILKLEERAIELGYGPFDEDYEYSENVTAGLNYIFKQARTDVLGGQDVVFWLDHEIYKTSIAMMAIAGSNSPDKIVDVPGSPVNGLTYKQVEELALNYLIHSQKNDGGWSYNHYGNPESPSDNSNTGYAVLGLIYAQNRFGMTIPEEVIIKLENYVDVIQDIDGSSMYMPDSPWPNILKTGNLLYEQKLVGYQFDDARVQAAVGYIEGEWNTLGEPGWKYNYQSMYTMMKGFESWGIETINVEGAEVDWYEEMSTFIVDNQNADGSWPSDNWGDTILATEWALLALERTVEIPVIQIEVDIKPGSCPNPLNLKSKGVLPVAILGTEDFNVNTIDPQSINMTVEDVGEEVSCIRWSYEDVGTPYDGDESCGCHEIDGDGQIDLTLKFDIQELVDKLGLVGGDDPVPLIVAGNLKEEDGGMPIEGKDCIWILDKGNNKDE
jgi:hypothetical protein